MKKIAILTLVLAALNAHSQNLEFDSTTTKFIYRGIVRVDSVNAGTLYERGRQWVALAYRSANHVIQYESKEEGKIIVKGTWTTYISLGWCWEHVLLLEFKDGRARYTFTDFIKLHTRDVLAGSRQTLESITIMKKGNRREVADEAVRAAESLTKALQNPVKKSDDW